MERVHVTGDSELPALDLRSTVERVLVAGFTEREPGRVRRPARARFWRYERLNDTHEEIG